MKERYPLILILVNMCVFGRSAHTRFSALHDVMKAMLEKMLMFSMRIELFNSVNNPPFNI